MLTKPLLLNTAVNISNLSNILEGADVSGRREFSLWTSTLPLNFST